ncbi:epso [Weissella halotolerans DSM 20190]|uniref:Epso n=1 Tax=Weissella halotolerans DSM 20190 TaxID=1123500 RepID=A0A0R2FSE7_9LACO|nr:epso [Weissella halotolerans DSM 20190]
MPDSVKACIASWEKFCPDFEIKQWNEDNFDVNARAYTKEAYNAGKYAFVTDVARLAIIKNEGGVYLDTDVELIKPLDNLLAYSAFMGMETKGRVNTGLGFGAVKEHPFIIKNLAAYDNRHFLLPNGKFDETSCVTITTNLLNTQVNLSDQTTRMDDMIIFEPAVFCPYDLMRDTLKITDKTVAIHHYDASWKDGKDNLIRLKMKLRRLLGSKFYDAMKAVIK